mgnify:CR=1 FL=1
MHGLDWHVQLPDGAKAPVDRNDFSFVLDGEKVTFDFAYITIHGTPGEDGRLQGYFDMLISLIRVAEYWQRRSRTISLPATSI